ncbi:hypothetical protein [Desulfocastanea catecholica]
MVLKIQLDMCHFQSSEAPWNADPERGELHTKIIQHCTAAVRYTRDNTVWFISSTCSHDSCN